MGNCLDKALSDSSDENIIESSIEQSNQADETNLQTERASRRSRRSRTSRQGSNRYMQINESNSSLSSLSSNPTHIRSSHHNHHHHRHHHHHHHHNQPHQLSQSLNFGFSNSSSFMPSSLPVNGISNSGFSDLMSSSGNSSQVYYLAPNIQRTADQLTEEEQIKLLKRMTLIQQLPTAAYDENKKNKECVICMIDFENNDTIRYLPCMHAYHVNCIDTWLLRSLVCPSCLQPVETGLLAAFE